MKIHSDFMTIKAEPILRKCIDLFSMPFLIPSVPEQFLTPVE